MYVQGQQRVDVQSWVDIVHELRYKEFQLVVSVSHMKTERWVGVQGALEEVDSVKGMATKMNEHGLREWWRKGMGFIKDE